MEQKQVLQLVFVGAERSIAAHLQLKAEIGKELFIGLSVVFQPGGQLVFDFALQRGADKAKLAVVLQHLAADIQREVGRIHKPLHKAEMVGQKVGAFFHDEHAAGIELQALFIFFAVIVVRCAGGDEQKRAVGGRALRFGLHHLRGRCIITEFLFIEIGVFLIRHFLFVALPQGHHAVQRLVLGVALVFRGLVIAVLVFIRAFDGARFLAQHADGPADIIGIFLHKARKAPVVQKFAVMLFALVVLDDKDDVRAAGLLLAGSDGVALRPAGFPLPRLALAVRAADDGDALCHHKRRVKAHAELADDVHLGVGLCVLLKIQAAAFGNGSKVLLQLLLRHAYAVVAHRQGARVFIQRKADAEVLLFHLHGIVCEAAEI